MIKLFLDDRRSFDLPSQYGYCCVRSYQECILLLSVYKDIDIINLDYDLGTKKTGLDVLRYMKQENIKVKHIYIHSTHKDGVSQMEKYIQDHFNDVKYSYSPYNDEI